MATKKTTAAPVVATEQTESTATAPIMEADAAPAVTKQAAPTPTVSDALVKIGRRLLESHADMEVVYMASDGLGFYTQQDALAYANGLKNKVITPVTRK